MGITGLLPFLKKIQRDVHISSFRGKKAAIDAYCWLHKGAYSCSLQLVMKTEKLENLPFIRYCMKRLNLLRQYDVTPVMVFDGGHLPTKSGVEKDRREKRNAYLKKGKALLKDGNKSQAVDCFQKCVDVSPEMALALIKECRREGIECIVAPYEADAQLAYLQKELIVDLVITEDSDMLVFGCKMVLFKFDESGSGKLVSLNDLGKANGNLVGFTQDSFRQTCILSGCDYLASVPGIGLGKASKLMKQYNKDPFKVIKHLQCQTSKVPKDYEENFRRAEHTFLYQLVFDPRTQTQVRLNEPPEDVDPASFEFAGVEHSPHKAVHMARGNIDPFTHEVLDTYTPSKAPPPRSMSWEASTSSAPNNHHHPVPIQARLPLTSSRDSQRNFKPPDRVAEDVSLGDEVLKTMYSSDALECSNSEEVESSSAVSSSEAIQSHSDAITISKFFGKPAPTCSSSSYDCTSSDGECRLQGDAVTKVHALQTPQNDETSTPTETLANHFRPNLQSAKKRLRFSDNENPGSNLQDRYGYSKAKKVRSEGLFAKMDSEQKLLLHSAVSPEQSKRNPFSKIVTLSQESASTCVSGSDSQCSVMSVECESSVSQDEDIATPPVYSEDNGTDSQSSLSLSQQLSNESSEFSSTVSYKTSKDFITSHASLQSSTQITSTYINSRDASEYCERPLLDRKLEPSSLTISQRNKGTFRAPLSGRKDKPLNKKGKMKVGLPKPGASSKFKPPRSTDTTLKQSTLFGSRYNYQKKEHMTL